MSDSPTPPPGSGPHSHEGHSHDHDHGHSHDHDSDHSHGPAETGDSPETPDLSSDSGAQALSDALRRSFAILKVLMVFLVLAFLLSNLHTVGPEERGVILRLGKPVGEGEGILLPPGLHLALPYPLDEFVRVPFSRLLEASSTIGWYYVSPGSRAAGQEDPVNPTLRALQDGYTITGDQNIVHVNASFSYRITDPAQYLFAFESAPKLLTNALNNAINYASSVSQVDAVLKGGIAAFKDRVRERLGTLILDQHLGVTVDYLNVTLKVPRQVTEDFNRVLTVTTQADADKNDARSQADRDLKEAASTASGIVSSARSERDNEVKRIQDEAKRFESLLAQWKKSPDLFKRRYLSELMTRISPLLENKLLLSDLNGEKRELRLLLNREEQLPVAPVAPTSGDKH